MSDYIVKIDKPGYAFCTYCSVAISYGSAGKKNLRKHAENNFKHKETRDLRQTNTALPLSYLEPSKSSTSVTCELPYGAEFKTAVKEAYINTAKYMQEKFPLTNRVLMALNGLDPKLIRQSSTYNLLKNLAEYFPTILKTKEDHDKYLLEISNIQLDEQLPALQDTEGVPLRLDHWWNKVFQSKKYPVLAKIVKACLSIFTGPHVESSFSKMNDIIYKKANRMDIATYDGIITVKYGLQSKTSSDVFHREDPFRDTIDKNNCYYLRTSCSRGKKRLECKNHKKISPAQKDWR